MSPRYRIVDATWLVSAAARPRPRASGWVHTALTSAKPGTCMRSPAMARSRPPSKAPTYPPSSIVLGRNGPGRRQLDEVEHLGHVVDVQGTHLDGRYRRERIVGHHLVAVGLQQDLPAVGRGRHGVAEEHDDVARPGEVGQRRPAVVVHHVDPVEGRDRTLVAAGAVALVGDGSLGGAEGVPDDVVEHRHMDRRHLATCREVAPNGDAGRARPRWSRSVGPV